MGSTSSIRQLGFYFPKQFFVSTIDNVITSKKKVDDELEDLENIKVYCAGFVDPEIKNRPQLYDLLVDLNERTITVPEHAKGDFKMGAFHKDLAEFFVESAENEEISALDLLKVFLLSNFGSCDTY